MNSQNEQSSVFPSRIAPESTLTATWVWVLVILYGLHALAISVGLADDELLAATGCASLALVAFAHVVWTRGWMVSLLPALAFVAGNVLVFACANFAHVRLTSLPKGNHHEITSWLAAVLAWSTFAGAAMGQAWLGREELSSNVSALLRSRHVFLVTAAMFVLFVTGTVSNGIWNGRWELPARNDFGFGYLIGGMDKVGYAVFFVLGANYERTLLHTKNIAILLFVLVAAVLQGMTGGREPSLVMLMLMLLGAIWSSLRPRQLAALVVVVAWFGTILAVLIGVARGRSGFAFGAVEDRIETVESVAEDIGASGAKRNDFFEAFVDRIAEPSAQRVIDHTALTRHQAGFEHFERLKYLLVPKVIAPEKRPLDDGKEILQRDYGYRLDERTSVPITLVADAYRRGGWLWVAAVGFAAGMILRLTTRLVVAFVGAEVCILCIAILTIKALRSYTNSVLGFAWFCTYMQAKYIAMFILLGALVKLSARLSGRMERAAIRE